MKCFDIIKLNMQIILKRSIFLASTFFSILAVLLSFITWDELGIKSICNRVLIFIFILIASVLIATFYSCFYDNRNVVWRNGAGKITVSYGDLMKIAFPRENSKEKIVVIPVNTCFDTIVDTDIALGEKPMVSPSTIHGKWLTAMINSGISSNEIDEKIKNYIKVKNIIPLHEIPQEQKKRGNRFCHKRGLVVPFKGRNKVTFFLLALSEFNPNNNAQCTKDELIECIKSLISFYNKNGQGFEMFLPLMGTNLSRVGLSHEEALNKITTLFKLYSDQVHGEINIIVYENDKDKVSILNI